MSKEIKRAKKKPRNWQPPPPESPYKKATKKKPLTYKKTTKKKPSRKKAKKGTGYERTAGEKERDLVISCVDDYLGLVLIHVEGMERSASFHKEHEHAMNYEKIIRLIRDTRSLMIREYPRD